MAGQKINESFHRTAMQQQKHMTRNYGDGFVAIRYPKGMDIADCSRHLELAGLTGGAHGAPPASSFSYERWFKATVTAEQTAALKTRLQEASANMKRCGIKSGKVRHVIGRHNRMPCAYFDVR